MVFDKNKWQRERYQSNADWRRRKLAADRTYNARPEVRARKSAYNRQYRESHPLTVTQRLRRAEQARRRYWAGYRESAGRIRRAWAQRVKMKVLLAYSPAGSSRPSCTGCGFEDVRGLSLDHMDGCGYLARLTTGLEGTYLYCTLARQGFPPGYQTLCMNCQWVKRAEKGENGGRKKRPAAPGERDKRGNLLVRVRECRRAWAAMEKARVLAHYSGGTRRATCVRCGAGDIRVLTLDHVEGGGLADRKARCTRGTGCAAPH